MREEVFVNGTVIDVMSVDIFQDIPSMQKLLRWNRCVHLWQNQEIMVGGLRCRAEMWGVADGSGAWLRWALSADWCTQRIHTHSRRQADGRSQRLLSSDVECVDWAKNSLSYLAEVWVLIKDAPTFTCSVSGMVLMGRRRLSMFMITNCCSNCSQPSSKWNWVKLLRHGLLHWSRTTGNFNSAFPISLSGCRTRLSSVIALL